MQRLNCLLSSSAPFRLIGAQRRPSAFPMRTAALCCPSVRPGASQAARRDRRSTAGYASPRRRECVPHRLLALRCAASAAPGGDASDWISRWKSRVASGEEPAQPSVTVPLGPDPRTSYRYVFAGGLSAEAHGFSALILRDALEPRGVTLHVPAAHPAETWTLSGALTAFEAAVAALPGDQPLRLIGASVGALVCALYAERHPERVDSLFLMSPTFNLRGCLERAVGGERGLTAWRSLGTAQLDGAPVHFSTLADVDSFPAFPFVRCRAYVAHGTEDGFAEPEDSLTWVRSASVNMRARGAPSDPVPERRLLELADGHALAASVPTLTAKLVEWHGLLGLAEGDYSVRGVDLEGGHPEDYARGHGVNFEVYRNWLRNQGLDPDDMD